MLIATDGFEGYDMAQTLDLSGKLRQLQWNLYFTGKAQTYMWSILDEQRPHLRHNFGLLLYINCIFNIISINQKRYFLLRWSFVMHAFTW